MPRMIFDVKVYESHYEDGSVHRDVFPVVETGPDESTAEQRAMASIMRREGKHGPVTGWSWTEGVVVIYR